MTISTLALKTAPVFIAVALPLAIMSCSADDAPTNQNDAGTGGTISMGGSGGASGSGAGQASKGGSSGTGTGGGSGTGGAGGAGATGKGGAGAGGAAGGAGKGTAGGGGMATGGASTGGAPTGGMAGVSSGGMGGATSGGMGGATGAAGNGGSAGGGAFTLTSPTHMDGAHFDSKFTCDAMNGTFGAGVNPELDWSGVPAGTKSLAMTFIDTTLGEDNSMGQHWAIWNVPWDGSKVSSFPEGLGMTLTGDLANAKQSGKFLTPCAQSVMGGMDDNYKFTLYALSTETLAITGTSVANALTALRAATPLGTATLTGHAGLKGQ